MSSYSRCIQQSRHPQQQEPEEQRRRVFIEAPISRFVTIHFPDRPTDGIGDKPVPRGLTLWIVSDCDTLLTLLLNISADRQLTSRPNLGDNSTVALPVDYVSECRVRLIQDV